MATRIAAATATRFRHSDFQNGNRLTWSAASESLSRAGAVVATGAMDVEPDDFADAGVFAAGDAAGVFVLSATGFSAEAGGANTFNALSLAAVLTSFDSAGGVAA